MLTPIDKRYLNTTTALARDIADMVKVCEARSDLTVTVGEDKENAPVVVCLNLPDSSLHELTVWTATHTDGRWWSTSSDTRFIQ
jgi:hypothetical protein